MNLSGLGGLGRGMGRGCARKRRGEKFIREDEIGSNRKRVEGIYRWKTVEERKWETGEHYENVSMKWTKIGGGYEKRRRVEERKRDDYNNEEKRENAATEENENETKRRNAPSVRNGGGRRRKE